MKSLDNFFNSALQRAYKIDFIRYILSSLVMNISKKRYVFIVGCYDSGTTLLNYILGCHDGISSLPTEGVALTNQLSIPEDFGWPRMWYKCMDRIRLKENDNKVNVSRLKKEWGFWFDKKKPIFIEKSISNSARIKWLNKNFDRPYFIWIIRNGYCVAEGIRRRVKQTKIKAFKYAEEGYPIEWCARQWIINNEIIENEIKNTKRAIKIKYEDLTDNSETTISSILQWLPVQNKHVPKFNHFKFHGKTSSIYNMNNESIARLSNKDIIKINEVAGIYLEKWGYPLLGK